MNVRPLIKLVFVLVACLGVQAAVAHPLAPSLFRLTLQDGNSADILWKQPVRQSTEKGIQPRLPEGCQTTKQNIETDRSGALTEGLSIHCQQPLQGRMIQFDGLAISDTYILAETIDAGGRKYTAVLNSDDVAYQIPASSSPWQSRGDFVAIGLHHLVTGIDHILFVAALTLLLVGRIRQLVLAFTCFTIGHTLALFGVWHGLLQLPSVVIEPLIMLSLVWMALELINRKQPDSRFSLRNTPYLLTLGFGLIHGSGFAGALMAQLAPGYNVALNILAFNMGVEAGQLGVALIVLLGAKAAKQLKHVTPGATGVQIAKPFAYGMGGISCYWLLKLALG